MPTLICLGILRRVLLNRLRIPPSLSPSFYPPTVSCLFFFHPTEDEQRVIGRLFTCRTPKEIEFFDCHPIDCLFCANKKLKKRELGLRLVSIG